MYKTKIFFSFITYFYISTNFAFANPKLDTFIDVTCSHLDNPKIEELVRKNYSQDFGYSVNLFLLSFGKYRTNTKNILRYLKEFTPKWKMNECALEYGSTDEYYKNWIVQFHKLQGKFFYFLPTSHFAGMTSAEIQEKMNLLEAIKIGEKALLLEGFEFHEQIPCQRILKYALTKKKDLITSEHTFMLNQAFWEGAPIIGADNQRLSQSDYELMEPGTKAKNEFLITHRILGNLASKEAAESVSDEKLEKLIGRALMISKLQMNVQEYQGFYKNLNKRNVPTKISELLQDLYPVEIQNLGTNILVDQIQETQRNKALLNAIEFSHIFFGPTLVVYGAYHYGVLRDEILVHSGEKIPGYCK